ncbi:MULTISPECIES: hypothetical protein [unclassified Streptomyces]|uniref:hypothetical protein n=1 Tax=Streptomyces sp. NPDC127532 TaxID=3345399 RepID=UPI00363522D0
MRSAQHLVDELARNREKDPVPNGLLDVAKRGALTSSHLRGLVSTESQCHQTELPAYAAMLSRFAHHPAAGFYIELIALLRDCGPKLDAAAEALGLSAREKAQWMWPSDRRAYSCNGVLSWITAQGSQASTALAVHTDMSVYFPGCTDLVAVIREQGMGAPEEFLSYYEADPCAETRRQAVEVVQDGLDRGDDPQEALLMARLLEESFADFWASAAAA